MIISMTGFGSAEHITEQYTLKVEIKTLNSKFLDAIIKIPKEFNSWEIEIKSRIENILKRGKVNLLVEYIPTGISEPPVIIQEELFKKYFQRFKAMTNAVGEETPDLFRLALQAPNVLMPREDMEVSLTKEKLLEVIEQACRQCLNFRTGEGEKLERAIVESVEKIEQGLEAVIKEDESRPDHIRGRILNALNEVKDNIQFDENRFEQELIYYLEKLDIKEEKVRLQSHLQLFRETLAKTDQNGKKLGFISQEIGREINTIGSKANHAGIQRSVVDMKDELEKIKEQLLNVL
jgi:uncharacterized protein (TIGR00255 family)